ncbi:glycosyltransferase family 4 protein [Mucilaginibacter sp. Bleaf8]|uniref:glycosyltransferase family 4 protein n=1 Tax=Mucilaginibacter sp. Bleaf8 TaxID=2834430 RepID=UPI001BCD0DF4|nr:glycosyltransferase family 1 protein [Mucilaginibacter sp. Bleaf8]MBS7562857.1 glycosyltransferase family 4 protein [Mucilaginibacter sp. Bleaf8]
MHIVIDARMVNASGIGVYLKNILHGIANLGKVTLLGNPAELSEFRDYGVIPFLEPIYSIKEQVKLRKLIPDCDIFWSPHYNIPLLPIKAKRRFVTIHDVYHLAYYNQLSMAQRIYAKIVINGAVRLSKQVITVSKFSKDEIIKHTGCNASKISVIYNGVKDTPSVNITFNELANHYHLPQKYLLFVGNVKPHKNLKTLLQAYLLLSEELRSEYKIVIVGKKDGFITGDPELFNWIDQNPGLSDRLIFTGFVADEHMDAIYKYASLFVFPSVYEGFGLPPLEAMLNQCPVAVSNAACMPEICGEAALYFDPMKPEDVSEKIQSGLTDSSLRQTLIEKGNKHTALFTWQESIKQHLQMFAHI